MAQIVEFLHQKNKMPRHYRGSAACQGPSPSIHRNNVTESNVVQERVA